MYWPLQHTTEDREAFAITKKLTVPSDIRDSVFADGGELLTWRVHTNECICAFVRLCVHVRLCVRVCVIPLACPPLRCTLLVVLTLAVSPTPTHGCRGL